MRVEEARGYLVDFPSTYRVGGNKTLDVAGGQTAGGGDLASGQPLDD